MADTPLVARIFCGHDAWNKLICKFENASLAGDTRLNGITIYKNRAVPTDEIWMLDANDVVVKIINIAEHEATRGTGGER